MDELNKNKNENEPSPGKELSVENISTAADNEQEQAETSEEIVKTDVAEEVIEQGVNSLLQEELTRLDGRLGQIMAGVEQTSEKISYIPGQIRNLGGRVDAVATSISESRYRSLLKDLLGIYDLIDQLIRSVDFSAEEADRQHNNNYRIIQTQISQILEYNGMKKIDTQGVFNPEIHMAVDRELCDDPQNAGTIAKVVRDGFRTDHQMLRYADVVIYYYQTPEQESEETDETTEDTTSDQNTTERGVER